MNDLDISKMNPAVKKQTRLLNKSGLIPEKLIKQLDLSILFNHNQWSLYFVGKKPICLRTLVLKFNPSNQSLS